MKTEARKVLVAGEASSFAGRAAELLPPPTYALRFAADARGATEIIQGTVFDVVVVEYAGEATVIRELVKGLRWSGSESKQATIILLSPPELLEEAEELLDTGISRILNPDASSQVLATALDEILNHEVRFPLRALVRINGEDLGHKGVLMTQTANLSTTGMLVRYDKQVFLGSRFSFSLEAPGLTKAIRGAASVVRLTHSRTERLTGFAARFTHFEGDGLGRLKGFLAAQPPRSDPQPGD